MPFVTLLICCQMKRATICESILYTVKPSIKSLLLLLLFLFSLTLIGHYFVTETVLGTLQLSSRLISWKSHVTSILKVRKPKLRQAQGHARNTQLGNDKAGIETKVYLIPKLLLSLILLPAFLFPPLFSYSSFPPLSQPQGRGGRVVRKETILVVQQSCPHPSSLNSDPDFFSGMGFPHLRGVRVSPQLQGKSGLLGSKPMTIILFLC